MRATAIAIMHILYLSFVVAGVMFYRFPPGGRFVRPKVNARWEPIPGPDESAHRLDERIPKAADLRFSFVYRKPDRNCSTTVP